MKERARTSCVGVREACASDQGSDLRTPGLGVG